MPFNPSTNTEHRRRLLEAMSWCLARHPIRDPQRDLRTPELEPHLEEYPAFAELDAAVSVLATRRRELLAGQPHVEDQGGRVLICEFNASIESGESEAETNGFFDVSDRPPWDTWMFCVQRKAVAPTSREPFDLDLLISWVPRSLVAPVDKGIRVNPYDCIYWASDADRAEWGLSE